ncbi:hypothetical protein FIBSPDRAFT_194948 [Athelia psychrophila]|uniref:Uncharacterized protein n=1 Tax=Athelia psychrophila TaxID=1759441 RepID=A0A166SLR0_9AGAM|nr:hypothetical protein FIBSPDRAFT_194948 [Fibularhizoctonia sp. CBS 109695]
MDLFDLESPSWAFQLLLGGLSDSNTLQVLNRLGFLASLDGGADAILSPVKINKDADESRLATLNRLLGGNDYIFLATVTLLARLATKASEEADRKAMKDHLVSHSYSVESISRSTSTSTSFFLITEATVAGKLVEYRWKSTDKGIAGRIDHCLAPEGTSRGEAVKTITEIMTSGRNSIVWM